MPNYWSYIHLDFNSIIDVMIMNYVMWICDIFATILLKKIVCSGKRVSYFHFFLIEQYLNTIFYQKRKTCTPSIPINMLRLLDMGVVHGFFFFHKWEVENFFINKWLCVELREKVEKKNLLNKKRRQKEYVANIRPCFLDLFSIQFNFYQKVQFLSKSAVTDSAV